jgi:hypothetical protein
MQIRVRTILVAVVLCALTSGLVRSEISRYRLLQNGKVTQARIRDLERILDDQRTTIHDAIKGSGKLASMINVDEIFETSRPTPPSRSLSKWSPYPSR